MMHEPENRKLAKMCHADVTCVGSHPANRSNAERPLETLCSRDAQCVENPTQSTARQRQCQADTTADLAGVCSSGGRNTGDEEKSRQAERLEIVGDTANDSGKSLHPKSKAELAIIPRPIGEVNTENVMRLLEYQQYRCALTGRKLTPQMAALDHIIPITLNGEHAIENVQVLHKDVNRAKGSLTNETFIGICQEVVKLTCQRRPGSPVCGDPAMAGAVAGM